MILKLNFKFEMSPPREGKSFLINCVNSKELVETPFTTTSCRSRNRTPVRPSSHQALEVWTDVDISHHLQHLSRPMAATRWASRSVCERWRGRHRFTRDGYWQVQIISRQRHLQACRKSKASSFANVHCLSLRVDEVFYCYHRTLTSTSKRYLLASLIK